jgi:hypothetical protein
MLVRLAQQLAYQLFLLITLAKTSYPVIVLQKSKKKRTFFIEIPTSLPVSAPGHIVHNYFIVASCWFKERVYYLTFTTDPYLSKHDKLPIFTHLKIPFRPQHQKYPRDYNIRTITPSRITQHSAAKLWNLSFWLAKTYGSNCTGLFQKRKKPTRKKGNAGDISTLAGVQISPRPPWTIHACGAVMAGFVVVFLVSLIALFFHLLCPI